MSRPGDYMGEMFNTTISHREIESLLTGSPAQNGSLSDLAGFVEMLRAYERIAPSEDAVELFATAAATQVRAAQAPTAAPTASSGRLARRPLGLRPQIAAMLTTLLLVAGSTGVAVAADGAAPGDGLYWLDRTVENLGIGDGSAGERLEEAHVLVVEGRSEAALVHVIEVLAASDEDVVLARSAVDAAIEDLEAGNAGEAAVNDEQVAALLTYLSANIGNGVGTDGREFGQGVAELARGITSDAEPTEIDDSENESAPGDQTQTDDESGIDESPGNGNGNGNSGAPGNGNSNGNPDLPGNSGNGNSSPNPGNSGDGNGDPNPPGTAPPGTAPPGTASDNTSPPGSAGGDPDPPGNNSGNDVGSGNGNGGGQGTGPPPESPSATAPGQVKKP